jgi:hypothetical protein
MAIIVPALPVLLQALRRNPVIVPRVPVPTMGSVVASPAGVYVIVENWDTVVIPPIPVIIPGVIPPTVPEPPPPPIPEEQVDRDVRHDVDIVRLRDHDHFRSCLKYDGGWQRNANTYIDRGHRWNRDANDHRQQQCSHE